MEIEIKTCVNNSIIEISDSCKSPHLNEEGQLVVYGAAQEI